MIPVDITTGLLKVGTDLQTSLSSRVKHYEMAPLGSGAYRIGVQTLDQAYYGSQFTTCTLDVVDAGVAGTVADSDGINVNVDGMTVTVDTVTTARVCICTPDGRLVATVTAAPGSTDYTFSSPGVYLVNVTAPASSRTLKIVVAS